MKSVRWLLIQEVVTKKRVDLTGYYIIYITLRERERDSNQREDKSFISNILRYI